MEVSDDLQRVTVGGHTFPVKVVAVGPTKVELEIAGERIVVDGWPEHFPRPPGPVDVGGERWTVKVVAGPAGRTSPAPTAPPAAATVPPATEGPGVPVIPPMPGKVLEVRVRDGDRVHRGDVLLRLEAMKMVNEILSPADGTVRELRVSAGTNVRAREPMMFVEPDPT